MPDVVGPTCNPSTQEDESQKYRVRGKGWGGGGGISAQPEYQSTS